MFLIFVRLIFNHGAFVYCDDLDDDNTCLMLSVPRYCFKTIQRYNLIWIYWNLYPLFIFDVRIFSFLMVLFWTTLAFLSFFFYKARNF
jgi:hypothetical protein